VRIIMAKKKQKADGRDLQQEILDSAHKIWLAGLGAFAAVEEGSTKTFKKLVDRGRDLESRGKKEADKARDKVESTFQDARDRFESSMDEVIVKLDDRLAEALHRFGVPTRDEIQELTRRVEELNQKVDAAKGKKATTRKPAAKAPARRPARTKAAAKEQAEA
jgi:poly(hydroxyalkanoate) granule-associated protein